MKKTLNTYIPFEHENFEYKKRIIDIAREQGADLQGVLTSTLIFVNAVDYIASHLLENLLIMSHLITHHALNATVFMSYPEYQKGLPLGEITKLLKRFEFPDKTEFISELSSFNDLRVKYIHRLLSSPPEDIVDKIDNELASLRTLGESLLGRYDTITKGMSDAWFSYLRRLAGSTEPALPVERLEEESPIVNSDLEKEKDKLKK